MMNNGKPQVLTGMRTNNGMAQPGQTQPQPNYNPFAMMAGAANKFAGSISAQNTSMASLYSYGPNRTNYAALIGLEDNIGEEQLKAQALVEGGHVANQIVNICIHRKMSNPMYIQWRNALERFKSPIRGGQHDPVMVAFVDDISNNQGLHNFIIVNAGIQFGSYLAWALMSGDESVRSNGKVLADIFYKSCIDITTLQFLDYLENNPQTFYKLSPQAKQALSQREEPTFDQVMSRYIFAGLECPYKKGKMSSIAENSTLHNPLLDVTEPANMGLGGNIFERDYGMGTDKISSNNEMLNWVINRANRAPTQQIQNRVNRDEDVMLPAYDNYDKPKLCFDDITRENRLKYNLSDYISYIGNTGWCILHRYHLDKISKVLDLEDGSSFSMRDTNVLGKLGIYKFNWQGGTFKYGFINYSVRDVAEMSELISDPSKLLPFMYDDEGVQKTTFDPKYMETSEFIREGKITPMEKMVELDKQPSLIVGSRPMKANQGNENTVARIDAFTEAHDPSFKLDAFVLPMANTRQWTLPADTDLDQFYARFKLMVQGNLEEKIDTARIIRNLRGQCREHNDEEFTQFVESYLTNLVNRWLIESRGYAENKDDTSVEYLNVGSIFEDLEELIQHLKDNDNGALRAFMEYGSNDYIRNGIEIILSKEDTQKEFEELYKNEDEESRAALMVGAQRKLIFKRNSVFINMIQENGPINLEAVYIKESINPKLFAIVRKAIEVAGRHFGEYPQVLMKFRKDEGNKVWAVTRSGLDPEGVFVLRTVSTIEDYTHPVPVC